MLNGSVLVIGATGGVGEGVVRALLRAGRRVVAVGRSAERLERLRGHLDDAPLERLETYEADFDVPAADGRTAAQDLAAAHGPFAGAVITIGTWGGATRPLLEVDDSTWESVVADNLTSSFRVLRAIVPVVGPGAAVVHISGQSAEFPYPGRALIGLTNAARKSLALSLAEELRSTGPRIYELIIGVTRTRPRREAGMDDARWISAEQVGERALALLDGQDGGERLHHAIAPPAEEQPATYRIDTGASIGHVALRVTDLDRSLRFYRDVLGFDEVGRFGDQMALLSAGGYHHHLALIAGPRPGLEHVAVRFPRAGGLGAALQQLRRLGVHAQGPVDHGETLSAYLADPDGNGIELYIDRQPTS